MVHVQGVHPFIEEAKEVGDWGAGGQRVPVAPYDVLEDPLKTRSPILVDQ